MIEAIKDRLNELLAQKDVSLVMLFCKDGRIIWHKGRKIEGQTIDSGEGFCRSFIQESISGCKEIFQDNVYLVCDPPMSDSARRLLIKNVIIYPIDKDFFMYIDSGTRMAFNDIEHGKIWMLVTLLKDSIQDIRKKETDIGGISGTSAAVERIKEVVLKFSLEEDCILLQGETGVGKTHIAELIHHYSGRRGKFVVVETTSINENLFENEVFGHRKGAFTGAVDSKRGLIHEAEGGTLFFDEISEIPLSFQSKLLRFIEYKTYRILGDPVEKQANIRILAATNKDLLPMIERREFRQDLYYRLNVLNIHIPPLRERKEDIHSLIQQGKKYLKGKAIGNGFWDVILEYPWPGNIRELFSVMKRAGILCDSPLTGEQIKKILHENPHQEILPKENGQPASLWNEFKAGKDFWEAAGKPFLNRELTRQQLKDLVHEALSQSGGKYINTLKIFNLASSQYKQYMKFLHKHDLQ